MHVCVLNGSYHMINSYHRINCLIQLELYATYKLIVVNCSSGSTMVSSQIFPSFSHYFQHEEKEKLSGCREVLNCIFCDCLSHRMPSWELKMFWKNRNYFSTATEFFFMLKLSSEKWKWSSGSTKWIWTLHSVQNALSRWPQTCMLKVGTGGQFTFVGRCFANMLISLLRALPGRGWRIDPRSAVWIRTGGQSVRIVGIVPCA